MKTKENFWKKNKEEETHSVDSVVKRCTILNLRVPGYKLVRYSLHFSFKNFILFFVKLTNRHLLFKWYSRNPDLGLWWYGQSPVFYVERDRHHVFSCRKRKTVFNGGYWLSRQWLGLLKDNASGSEAQISMTYPLRRISVVCSFISCLSY